MKFGVLLINVTRYLDLRPYSQLLRRLLVRVRHWPVPVAETYEEYGAINYEVAFSPTLYLLNGIPGRSTLVAVRGLPLALSLVPPPTQCIHVWKILERV